MERFLRFLLSLRTAYGAFLFLVLVFFVGSLSLPSNLAFFSGIDDAALFVWLAAVRGYGVTWWIYTLVLGLAFFAVTTVLCTGDALLAGRGRAGLLAWLSPHVLHAGVLFVMLGHLLTAAFAVRLDLDIAVGETKSVREGITVSLEGVREELDENGYTVDWSADLRWNARDGGAGRGVLRPARPLAVSGYGLYSRSVLVDEKGSSALIRVCRDPGALPALFGGIVMLLGGAGILYGRSGAPVARSSISNDSASHLR